MNRLAYMIFAQHVGAVMNNHTELLDLWDFSLNTLKDT